MKKTTFSATSHWKKSQGEGRYPLVLRVETEKEMAFSAPSPCTATFYGDNPFPCFSMKTTYAVLAAWLKENGWEQYGNTSYRKVEDTIDDTTGEILCHWCERTIIRKEVK